MTWRIHIGDCREVLATLDPDSAQCCVTSPPYWGLRDYGVDGQIGLEDSVEEYVDRMVEVFRAVRRVLRPDGTLWLNLGDVYAGPAGGGQGLQGALAERMASVKSVRRVKNKAVPGLKRKDLIGLPWRVAFALQADGWYLRSDIVWSKPNPTPESVQDRPTKSHEYVFLLSAGPRYFYDADAVRTPLAEKTLTTFGTRRKGCGDTSGLVKSQNLANDMPDRRPRLDDQGDPVGANLRSVWSIGTQPYPSAHFATMAPRVAELCVLAGSAAGDEVLDPFAGAGTTGLVAGRLGRSFTGIELNPEYAQLARSRIEADAPLFNAVQLEESA